MAEILNGEQGDSVRSKLNQAISDWVDFSADLNPTGFSSLAVEECQYRDDGEIITMWVSINGTSNATTLGFTLPVAPHADYGSGNFAQLAVCINSGTAVAGRLVLTGGSVTASVHSTVGAVDSWTASGNKGVRATIVYRK